MSAIGCCPKQAEFEFDYKPNTWVEGKRDPIIVKQERQAVLNWFGIVEGKELLNGLDFYDAEKFEQAAEILLSINIQNDTLSLYQANALIKINEGQDAVTILEKITPNSPFEQGKRLVFSPRVLARRGFGQG